MSSRSALSSIIRVGLLLLCYANTAHIPIRGVPSSNISVKLKTGTLEGVFSEAYDQDFFLGVPYAKPPVGDLRFRRPQRADAWEGVRAAHEYGSWCYGVSIRLAGFSQNNTGPMSEDCLTLNIVRPAHTPGKAKLPVAVWIHGGGYSEGGSADQRYNGSFLVQESVQMGNGIIFVSFNYRLGIFGLMAGPVLEQTGDTNIAIHDQRMALTWIQENISKFGGDPDHVTIFGESAGAASVGFHLIAHGGRDSGLFHAAIAHSGGPYSYNAFTNATQRRQEFQNTLGHANCTAATDALACLRSVPAAALNGLNSFVTPYPILDGDLVEDYSSKLLAKGAFRKVPLLIGTNRNEGSAFLRLFRPTGVTTETDFFSFIQEHNPGQTLPQAMLRSWSDEYKDEIFDNSIGGLGTISANPGPGYGAFYGKSTLWIGDLLFTAGRRFTNQMWSKHGVPSYSYLFDTVPANLDPAIAGSAHFSDVCFAFGNLEGLGYSVSPLGTSGSPQNEVLRRLAKHMSRMWISFFVHKTPNHHGIPNVVHWPTYSITNATNIVLSAVSGDYTTPDTWREKALQTFIDLAPTLRR
ncbi:uncharacterized protein EKO05_0007075 [Ascochyta rabiei]|uniref:Carboxylic ester hydrolase n=1 Tax=Didymella rabiei TaxID=5454 RepID=A0A163G5C5_DIDRA|nr:uncharacterized protein EKO05_0007075 [Ascochyta rabiei]KZM24684.1 hydrolase [Ascochyta rabiei]UPX16686.1 hypothetical protein EKO05_0007075 [Ascochyta rabiei]